MIIGNGVEILHEDDFIIVCKKPSGLATQTKQTRTNDLVNILKKHLYMQKPKDGEPYLGVIHRLDQPVSGILVFAKDPKSAAKLSKSMQDNDLGKHYATVLSGVLPNKQGQLVDYMIKSDKDNFSKVCTSDTNGAKKAVLNYHVTNKPSCKEMALFPFIDFKSGANDLCFTHIKLETGRHHQIRVQTSHANCPIVGDTKYGNQASVNTWQNIALCAYKLNFKHPISGKELAFSLI